MASGVKLVVVGDSGVGKTTLLIVYCHDTFPTDYTPNVFDNSCLGVTVDNKAVTLKLVDASRNGDRHVFDRLRPLMYPGADAVLVCFSVDDRESFKNVTDYWYPELQRHIPEVPTVLVGTKSDLRKPKDTTCISRQEAKALATELGCEYCETSSLLKEGLHGCMETAIRTAMFSRQRRPTALQHMFCCGGLQENH